MPNRVFAWLEYLAVAQDALYNFAEDLQEVSTDEEFMKAYGDMTSLAGALLEHVLVPDGGGTIDDLREAFNPTKEA